MAKKKAAKRQKPIGPTKEFTLWHDEHLRCREAEKRAKAAEAEVIRIRGVIDLAASESERRWRETYEPKTRAAEALADDAVLQLKTLQRRHLTLKQAVSDVLGSEFFEALIAMRSAAHGLELQDGND